MISEHDYIKAVSGYSIYSIYSIYIYIHSIYTTGRGKGGSRAEVGPRGGSAAGADCRAETDESLLQSTS